MDDMRQLIATAASAEDAIERRAAFTELVARFQGMAYGYAWSILGDFHLAEDVTQESFLQAFRSLPQLEKAEAFPAWLRRIVESQCSRVTRRRRLGHAPLDAAATVAASGGDPAAAALKQESASVARRALMSLPDAEREVTALFYIDGYSQAEVAGFLGVPVSTVNSRLHAARGHLRERMTTMAEDLLKNNALGEDFAHRLMAFPFPRIAPEVEVADLPGENMTVRCVDAQSTFTPLEEGARCDWCFYDWPDWQLTGINETRVVDWARDKARAACRIWTKYTPLPDGDFEWQEHHILLEADSWRRVTLKRYTPGVVLMGTYRWPNDPQDYAAPPQPMSLSVGTKWDEGEVTGVAGVKIGERSWRCLKVVWAVEVLETPTAAPTMYAEWYVAENGRTAFFRRYNGKGYTQASKPTSYESLAGSIEVEFRGVKFRHAYDCIADFALEDIFGR